jgi:hypothetical protein
MDNLDAIVGQRVEPALTGENTTLTTYVGSARYHFLAIGDANYAPNITRFGLQATIAGAVRGFQSSQALSPREKLTDTFTAARNAVEAARTENQYTSPTGAALTVAIVHPEGVCVGRMGGGRVHLLLGGQLHALFEGPGLSYVGGGAEEPEISEHLSALSPGDKVITLSEQAYGGTLGQLPELTGRKAPQLAAIRVVEAARRRGQRESLAALVLQIKDRDSQLGIDLRGAQIDATGPSEQGRSPYRSSIYGPPRKNPLSSLLVLLMAAFIGGGAVGLYHAMSEKDAKAPGDAPQSVEKESPVLLPDTTLKMDDLVEPDVADSVIEEEPEEPSMGDAERIHAIFLQDTMRGATRALRRYARRRVKYHSNDAFVHLTEWVRLNSTENTIAVLEAVLQKKLHFELRRWVGHRLAELARKALHATEDNHVVPPKP